jgi:hypothetical protein
VYLLNIFGVGRIIYGNRHHDVVALKFPIVMVYQYSANWYCIAMLCCCMINDYIEYGTVHITLAVPYIFVNVELFRNVMKSSFFVYM